MEESRQRLLDNTERLERSGKKLDVGYKVCVETEEVGTKILGEISRPKFVFENIHATYSWS